MLASKGISKYALSALAALFLCPSYAAKVGYSLTEAVERKDVTESVRGFEGRINLGGGHTDRYSGDRWSLAIGHVPSRLTHTDEWIDTPVRGVLGHAKAVPSYQYINFAHRWYTRKGRFNWALQLRLFVGTGVAWRNAETCAWSMYKRVCWDGTAAVSNRWAFHQTAGFVWRERVEVAHEHDSTGGISALNMGDDIRRVTFYVLIGKK